ncbi:MAG TPA: HEAT repeat domain-containing protein [Thermoanaerobaculia bacterium]|nr:HEAT repeat domain-containing protein [Thermoanaerobaculia bacterium]
MRSRYLFAVLLSLFLAACASVATAPPPSATAAAEPHGFTIDEEATILRLEDRREYDPVTVAQWLQHPNFLHRARMALALGRIGQATFIDSNGNGEKDASERMAGVDALIPLATDPDLNVRRAVAVALGEIGDPAAGDTLFSMTRDREHADVSSEAVEALSKIASSISLPRYLQLTTAANPEGVRARAIRFLFRFATDPASEAAMQLLGDASSSTRREAAYALGRRPLATARPRLELLLNDPETLTRSYAARALGRIADEASLEALLRATGDVHPWVRSNVAVAISQIAVKNPASIDRPAILQDILRIFALVEDPDPGTRASAIDALSHYAVKNHTARARLDDVAMNGTRWERELAAGAIAGRFGAGGFTGTTSEAMQAPWAQVRILEATSNPSSAGLRKTSLTNRDVLIRSAAVGAIPDDQVDREIDLIREALNDADVVVRANAIERYGLTTSETTAKRWETLLAAERRGADDAMNDARIAAVRALASLDHPSRESSLRSWLQDTDPVVRRAASDLIVEKLKANRPQFTPLPIDRSIDDYREIVRWSRVPHTATIHMVRGKIELALLSQDAPMTAKNFADLATKGFFDNTSFMRVVPNFVIQGGDPRNDMNGGPGYAIRDEINMQRYTRGAVGMALSGADTGGSQFFITHSPQPHLDGGYTIFGRVIDGMGGVVDQTERGDKVTTIKIDEAAPGKVADFSSSEKTPLPTEIGTITPARLLSMVPEYADRKRDYKPDDSVVEMIASSSQPGDRLEVYLGTWCDDSQREVPRLLKILESLETVHKTTLPVSYVAVDRSKKKPEALLQNKSIEKVATFILFRGNEEIGRIVETPDGLLEDHLLQLFVKKK